MSFWRSRLGGHLRSAQTPWGRPGTPGMAFPRRSAIRIRGRGLRRTAELALDFGLLAQPQPHADQGASRSNEHDGDLCHAGEPRSARDARSTFDADGNNNEAVCHDPA
jgi:hypothetical protein